MSARQPVVLDGLGEDHIVACLGQLQRAFLKHPEASRALVALLAAEGRRYARTAAGGDIEERLRHSELLHRAHLVWDAVSLWSGEDEADGALPTVLLDAFVAAASSPERDLMLDRLFREQGG